MASPTSVGSDPVFLDAPVTPQRTAQTTTDPVSSEIVKPDKPIMGNIVSLSKDDWSAWTGGKPTSGWTGLASPTDELSSPNQLRPAYASASQKAYNYRRTGMTTPFSMKSSLVDFQNAIWDHLTDCGMDTIAYLPDPEDPLLMTNIVKSHSRYTIQTAKTLGAKQLTLYDKYDKTNDRAAVTYLLSSLEPTLMSRITEKSEDSDPFFIVWLQLIKTVQSTSIERFEDLKMAIKRRHPSQYPGENLESLAADFRKDARELTTAGQYDHNLTLSMLKTFLLAGGAGNEDFRFPLRATKQRLNQALLDIGYKEKSGAQAHMVAEKLTYQDICRQAEDVYRTQYDRKEWPPSSNKPDPRAPNATFGNLAESENTAITRAEALNLIQQASNHDQTQAKRRGNCQKCGKPGHWANKCPLNANQGQNSGRRDANGTGNRQNRAHKPQSWRTAPPPPGTANSKKVKDKTFSWCDKCRRWTTTHTTATHTGERRKAPGEVSADQAQPPQVNLTMLEPDPSVWLTEFPMSPTPLFFIPTFSDIIFLLSNFSSFLLLLLCIALCCTIQTFINWIGSGAYRLVVSNPIVIFAPLLWLFLLTSSLITPKNIAVAPSQGQGRPFNRRQRRQFARVLRPYQHSRDCPRTSTGIRSAGLHKSYPFRLRKNKHVIPKHAPTVAQRAADADLDELKRRSLNLQRRARRYRTRRSPYPSPVTDQKGEKTTPCKGPVYCPVPEVAASNAFKPAAWTAQQIHAAHKIVTQVNLACHPTKSNANMAFTMACATTLRMALQAPSRMRDSLGPTANTSPVIWDSGASISISPDPSDFMDTLRPPSAISQLKGIARGLRIKGQGEVTWALHDVNGNLRLLKLPAYYVPGIKVRLLSTTSLLQTYSPETINIEAHRMTLSGVPGDPTRGSVTAVTNPQNNLPTSEAYNGKDPFKAAEALVATISEVHSDNHNLSEAEKELLRWHYRLGHIGFKRIQFLLRSGVLSRTEASRSLHAAACKVANPPKCAACQYGKQHRRPIPGKTPSTVVKDRQNALKSDNLLPGQRISVDHFICSTRGRLITSAGKTKAEEMYTGGCMFVDHASGFIHIEHQVSLSSHETLKAKEKFESICRSHGITPQEYLADNSKTFTSAEFSEHLDKFHQVMHFAGVGAHHHNGVAERNIRTVMAIARTMMLHSAIHWPSVADATLWPLAVTHAVFLINHVPDPRTGLSPSDIFTKTRWEQRKFSDLHVWGCPVYVLDKMISDGRKLPRWTPRSTRTINVGFSPKHASTVPLVLNPQTGYITPQYHVVFDDWFATVPASVNDLPDFNSDAWQRMFRDSTYQYIMDDDDHDKLTADTEDYQRLHDANIQQNQIADAIEAGTPPIPLPVELPPMAPPPPAVPTTSVPDDGRLSTSVSQTPPTVSFPNPLLTPREETPQLLQQSPPLPPVPPTPPSPVQLFRPQTPAPAPTRAPAPAPTPIRPIEQQGREVVRQRRLSEQVIRQPRRSTRVRNAPDRLGYDGQQGRGYLAEVNLLWLINELGDCEIHYSPSTEYAYKATTNDPDTLSFDEVLRDGEFVDRWLKSAQVEISALEKNGTWIEVDISVAKTRILPGTWVFRRKRTPDGEISKYKARYCVRGDLQESVQDTFAPVVAWSSYGTPLSCTVTCPWMVYLHCRLQ